MTPGLLKQFFKFRNQMPGNFKMPVAKRVQRLFRNPAVRVDICNSFPFLLVKPLHHFAQRFVERAAKRA